MEDWLNFFAYDDLMNLDVMQEHGLEYRALFSVTLSSYRVVFNKIPIDNGGQERLGLTNIIPIHDNLGSLEGVLYEMKERFLPKGFTYIAVPERTGKRLLPNKALMKRLKGAKKNLQSLYFYRLMNIRTVD